METLAPPLADTDALAQWHCQQVLLRFFLLLDEYRYADMLPLLHEQAEWHRQGKVLRGHAQILEAMHERSPTVHVRHILTNTVFDMAGPAEVRAVSYLTGYKTDPGVPAPAPVWIHGPVRVGVVDTAFRRTAAGWRIASVDLRSAFEFSSPDT